MVRLLRSFRVVCGPDGLGGAGPGADGQPLSLRKTAPVSPIYPARPSFFPSHYSQAHSRTSHRLSEARNHSHFAKICPRPLTPKLVILGSRPTPLLFLAQYARPLHPPEFVQFCSVPHIAGVSLCNATLANGNWRARPCRVAAWRRTGFVVRQSQITRNMYLACFLPLRPLALVAVWLPL